MANNKEAARARRTLKAEGGKRLGQIVVKDPLMWAQILHDRGALPFWNSKDPTEEQLRAATEKLISEWCGKRHREKAEQILEGTANPPALSWQPSAGGHWSLRTGENKDKGRQYTEDEIDEFLDGGPDLHRGRCYPGNKAF
jgi:hypothetical protein